MNACGQRKPRFHQEGKRTAQETKAKLEDAAGGRAGSMSVLKQVYRRDVARKKRREERLFLIQIRVFSESADLEPRRVCRVLESVNAVVQGDRREHETQHLTPCVKSLREIRSP